MSDESELTERGASGLYRRRWRSISRRVSSSRSLSMLHLLFPVA